MTVGTTYLSPIKAYIIEQLCKYAFEKRYKDCILSDRKRDCNEDQECLEDSLERVQLQSCVPGVAAGALLLLDASHHVMTVTHQLVHLN